MSGSKCFTVIVRGQEFKLSKGQIEFDTVPNLFSSCYLGPITLDRNPQLFAIIVEYLSGYDVLPLSERALPPTMDTKTALRNLLIDAEFYGLARLQRMLTMPSSPTIDMQWAGLSRQIVTLEDVLGDHLPPTVEYIEGGLYCHERGNPQPVIVCACDMPLRLAASRDINPPSNDSDSSKDRVWFTIDFAGRQGGGGFANGIKHPPSIVANTVFPGGFLHVNESKRPLSEFESWWSSPNSMPNDGRYFYQRLDPQQSEYHAQTKKYTRYEAVLWADEILFTVTGRSSDAGDPILHIRLLNVKARTRAAILDDLSPPCSRWARA